MGGRLTGEKRGVSKKEKQPSVALELPIWKVSGRKSLGATEIWDWVGIRREV